MIESPLVSNCFASWTKMSRSLFSLFCLDMFYLRVNNQHNQLTMLESKRFLIAGGSQIFYHPCIIHHRAFHMFRCLSSVDKSKLAEFGINRCPAQQQESLLSQMWRAVTLYFLFILIPPQCWTTLRGKCTSLSVTYTVLSFSIASAAALLMLCQYSSGP